jgi:programmed cell death protein 5
MSLLDNEARERLSRIAIVKPNNARSLEELILRMAQTGQIRSKLSEQQLIELLGNISENKTETKIVYNRRRELDSDEDEWDL